MDFIKFPWGVKQTIFGLEKTELCFFDRFLVKSILLACLWTDEIHSGPMKSILSHFLMLFEDEHFLKIKIIVGFLVEKRI